MILMQIASDHITMASDGKIQLCGLIFPRAHHLLLLAPHLNEVRVLHLLATTGLAVGKSFAGNSLKPFGYDRGSTAKFPETKASFRKLAAFCLQRWSKPILRGQQAAGNPRDKVVGFPTACWFQSQQSKLLAGSVDIFPFLTKNKKASGKAVVMSIKNW
jgi:hypothetical protein